MPPHFENLRGDIMLKKIEKSMQRHNIMPKKSVLVGLSGGADSVVLTYAMCELSKKHGFIVYSAHVNHGIRGKEADNDAKFCEEFAKKLGIRHFSKCVDIPAMSEATGESEELCGRRARYDFFSQIMGKEGIEFCATAHHKNDNAETVIMNFLRGTGIAGLSGIPVRRDNFIRPMLDVTREEIEDYCRREGLSYVTDSTNTEVKYTRNKIRNQLIPTIEREFNPNITETLSQNSEIMSIENDYLDTVTRAHMCEVCDNGIEITKLAAMHRAIALRVIRKMIENVIGLADISGAKAEAIFKLALNNETGKTIPVKGDVTARTEYGRLVISETSGECYDFSYPLVIGGSRYIPELDITVTVEPADKITEKGKNVAYMTLPEGEISIRNRRKGDIFYPAGLGGTKKVKEYMINEKIPKNMRSRVGIITINDEIAWLCGYRADERFVFDGKGIKIKITY